MARSVVSWQAAERGRARDHQTCSGDVVDAVLAVAEADGDVVVMVTGEREGFLDALRGSTREGACQRSRCPVLAVPAVKKA